MKPREVVISQKLGAFLTLRRVIAGGVAYDDGMRTFFDGGRRVPSYLDRPFRELIEHGHVLLRRETFFRFRVAATESGLEHYAALCAERRKRRD